MDFKTYMETVDYPFLKKFAKRSGTLGDARIENLSGLPWWTVKEIIPAMFNSEQWEEAMAEILSRDLNWVKKRKNKEKFLFLLWIKDQYDQINDLERTYHYIPPNPKMVAAGVRNLDVLGNLNTLDLLAQGDILKWDLVKKMTYGDVFDKLLKITIEHAINLKMKE